MKLATFPGLDQLSNAPTCYTMVVVLTKTI